MLRSGGVWVEVLALMGLYGIKCFCGHRVPCLSVGEETLDLEKGESPFLE